LIGAKTSRRTQACNPAAEIGDDAAAVAEGRVKLSAWEVARHGKLLVAAGSGKASHDDLGGRRQRDSPRRGLPSSFPARREDRRRKVSFGNSRIRIRTPGGG